MNEWEPDPCEYCWIVSGVMKVCDGCCDSLTQRRYDAHYGRYRWQGKPLIHNGRKP